MSKRRMVVVTKPTLLMDRLITIEREKAGQGEAQDQKAAFCKWERRVKQREVTQIVSKAV